MMVRYLPVRRPLRRLSVDELARGSGVHPGLLRRFVALGLVRATRDATSRSSTKSVLSSTCEESNTCSIVPGQRG